MLLQSFSGTEGISRLFEFQLNLLSENRQITFDDLVAKQVTIRIRLADDTERYINGYVSRFGQSGSDSRFAHYHMEVVPWLWFLTRSTDCRIFQNLSVTDVIKKVFDDAGFQDYKFSTMGSYDPLEYCVQYRESAFHFVSRLMEQFGIFYFFEHEDGKHTLVLADSASAHSSCPGQESTTYQQSNTGMADLDVVTGWQFGQEMRTGKYHLGDYNFETPETDLTVDEPTVVSGTTQGMESYDYPGLYSSKSAGQPAAKLRMEMEEAQHKLVRGSGICRAFTSGYKFDLQEHYRGDMNGSYVLTEVTHQASVGDSYTYEGSQEGDSYSNEFTCIPAAVPYRAPRNTPKPFVQGPQVAVVTGPSGEEIYTDEYGRVKVQFFWDRVGQKDENTSCWARVSQPWAGESWGAMWIPRIGQEVLIDFLEGDPDRPIIIGRVYNATQTVPYTLPDHQTVSTFKSNSSKGGDGYNELRFEDKKGSEQLYLHAEYDMDVRVKNDSREYVENDRSLIIKNDQKEKISGNQHIQVEGNRMEKVGESMSLKIGQDLNEKTGNKFAHEAGMEIHLKGGMQVTIEAGTQLTLKVGGNFVDIGPAGVTIEGTMVMINSGGAAGSGSGSSPQDPEDPDEADPGDNFGKA